MTRYLCALALSVCTALTVPASAAPTWEDSCASLDRWDVLDLRGDGNAAMAIDYGVPAGFGHEVIHLQGTGLMLMPKGLHTDDGVYTVLYRENKPQQEDADGVTMVGAQYGDDLSVEHNTKEQRPHWWIEQDNDGGFQLREHTADGRDTLTAVLAGVGLVNDPWNRTGWIWQQVRIDGDTLRAKYWPAELPEPAGWIMTAPYRPTESDRSGRTGVKIVSGDVNVAYFSFGRTAPAISPPRSWLTFNADQAAQVEELTLDLFTNLASELSGRFRVDVRSHGVVIGDQTFEATIGTGPQTLRIVAGTAPTKEGDVIVRLTDAPQPGDFTVTITDPTDAALGARTIPYHPSEELRARFEAVDRAIELLGRQVPDVDDPVAGPMLRTIHDVTVAHREHARLLFRDGDTDEAVTTLGFAEGALAELSGWKESVIRGAVGDIELPSFAPTADPDDNPEKVRSIYSTRYSVSFDSVETDARSFVMGGQYDVTIPWRVQGESPDHDYHVEVALVSWLGDRIVAKVDTVTPVPTSTWQPGETYRQTVPLSILPERQRAREKDRSRDPRVRDEDHYLVIRMYDPATGANLLLDNHQFPQSGSRNGIFCAGTWHVAARPVEIRGLRRVATTVNEARVDTFGVRNTGSERRAVTAVFTAQTETGRVLHREAKRISAAPNESVPVAVTWTPNTAGTVTLHVGVYRGTEMLTAASRNVGILPPQGYAPELTVGPTSRADVSLGDAFTTPVTIRAGRKTRISAEVFGTSPALPDSARLLGEESRRDDEITVYCEPWIGYYDVHADFRDFRWERRVLATSVTTGGGELLVNGEPFIVKGVNVHGLDSSSPERARTVMRLMRRLGFNTWRGDHPVRWIVDMAAEENTFWTVLAPFSCASTSELFAETEGPQLTAEREITRLFADRYASSPGVLLWNSSNEIGGATTDMLLSFKPLYEQYDPYRRPVHYANLYGQNRWQGQDVMGVNYYFGSESGVGRQPIVMQSIDLAKAHEMPVIYTEFNAYGGPVPTDGAEAMRDLFEWGVDAGMSGGFFYMKVNSTSHPGIYDGNLVTNRVQNDAVIKAFADADVLIASSSLSRLVLNVRNRRKFWLRAVNLAVSVDGMALQHIALPDISPEGLATTDVRVPPTAAGPSHMVTGELSFVTHHGLHCAVPVTVIVER